ncbi:MAG: acyl-CoA dehydrogenase, partial [Chloroflexi bacterium]
MADFTMTPEIKKLRADVRAFMDEFVYPNEDVIEEASDEQAKELIKDLQARTKKMGYWAPHLPKEAGGMGIGFMPYVYMNEILGRSFLAPITFGAQAPDSGNAEILWQFGTDEQKEQWLKPLVNGDIRSCFSMTEPEVPGSDPTTLQTRAVRDGDDWVINGHKWFTSGAIGATFAIVMCVSDPEA